MSQRPPIIPEALSLTRVSPVSGARESAGASAAWDKAGIGISAACMMHCTALPLLLTLSPSMLGGLLNHNSFHQWLLLLILPTALIAFGIGWSRHRRLSYLVPGLLGLTLVVLAVLFGHEVLGELGEKLLTFSGGLALVIGHMMNLRRSAKARA